jgi:hypothetical protein
MTTTTLAKHSLHYMVSLIAGVLCSLNACSVCMGDDNVEKSRAKAAKECYERHATEFLAGRMSAWPVYLWSDRWAKADLSLETGATKRASVAEAHLARMKEVERALLLKVAQGHGAIGSFLAASFYRGDAEYALFCNKGNASKEAKEALINRLAAAVLIYEDMKSTANGFDFPIYYWLGQCLDGRLLLATSEEEKITAAKGYITEATELEKANKKLVEAEKLNIKYYSMATYFLQGGELVLLEIEGKAKKEDDTFIRLDSRKLQAAKSIYDTLWKEFVEGRGMPEGLYEWSLAWQRSESAVAKTKADGLAAMAGHLARMKELQKRVNELVKAARRPVRDSLGAEYYVCDAEALLLKEKGK